MSRKITCIVTYNADQDSGKTGLYKIMPEKLREWASQFGTIEDEESVNGYNRWWLRGKNNEVNVIEFLQRRDETCQDG